MTCRILRINQDASKGESTLALIGRLRATSLESAKDPSARAMAQVAASGGSMRLRDLFYFSRPEPEPPQPILLADEAAPAREPEETLVLIHGHYWKDGVGHAFDPRERAFLFEPFRRDGRFDQIRKRYRVLRYLYPTHASYAYSAGELARQLSESLPSGSGRRDLTLVAHSMGGLVARYALQKLGLGERTRQLLTLATPHHGTILASMVMARSPVRRKIGWFGYLIQRLGRRIWTPSQGMLGMASDNSGGFIEPSEESEMGLAVNHELARLNATDPYLDRLVCLMGRVRGWWLRGRTLWDQIPRWFMSRHRAEFSTLDPLIHLGSGLAEGLSVRARHVLDDLDHEGIVTSPRTLDLLYELLLSVSTPPAAQPA